MNIIKPSSDVIVLMSSDMALKEAAEQYLLIATLDWDWGIKGNMAATLALMGDSNLELKIKVDFKEEIEKHLSIMNNDTIFLVYDILVDVKISKDKKGKIIQAVVEYFEPKYIINAKTGKAVEVYEGGF